MAVGTALAVVLLIALDVARKIDLMRPVAVQLFLLAALNLTLWFHFMPGWWPREGGIALCLIFLLVYMALRLCIVPVRDGHRVGFRLKAMIGGRWIALQAMWGMLVEACFLLSTWSTFCRLGVSTGTMVRNAVIAVLLLLLLLANGVLRMFFTSRRLSVLWRIVLLMTVWIPAVNLIVFAVACRIVYEEYDFACYKRDLHLVRAHSDLCRTKYPLVLVHGVLFRDLKYFNYWGRIPRELRRYGATIYYGNQEAVGTIAENAADISKTIQRVLTETGCGKVNIIAHSKGGLDARYAISALGLEEQVASLTTVCTPHRGCRFIDIVACRMPEKLYRGLSNLVDGFCRRIGEEHPDFYTAIRQFSTDQSAAFNGAVQDSPKVYYQSYMSRMKHPLSDFMLGLPFCLIKMMEGDNDGLVAVESAIWGDYKGLLVSKGRRGVSHGDIIDLKREDYRGFDVLEAYVGIVSQLKANGY